MYNSLVVLGPTASGKTKLACRLAHALEGEIISADSRQVYKYLTIGTGKDLHEYTIDGKEIPYHLIDIHSPNEQFFLHQFIEALNSIFPQILKRNKIPIICGGTGLYLDALHKDFSYTQIKENETLRIELNTLSKDQLITRIKKYPTKYTIHVDQNSVKRLIRGIEIAEYLLKQPQFFKKKSLDAFKPLYLGIKTDAEERNSKIAARLQARMNEGLINEVEGLLKMGVSYDRLQQLGLEYKFVSLFLQKKINEEQLLTQLQTAICKFGKRQMTWFRKMEKEGIAIRWLNHNQNESDLMEELKSLFRNKK